MVIKKCVSCGEEFEIHNYRSKTAVACSRKCLGVYVGKVRREKQNVRTSTQGYRFVKKIEYHRANKQGYAKCADIVLEEKIGRKLLPGEVAHHIDHDKLNDSPDNLELIATRAHSRLTSLEMWDKLRRFKWSIDFKKCLRCNTTKVRHWAKGLCKTCYKTINRRKLCHSK